MQDNYIKKNMKRYNNFIEKKKKKNNKKKLNKNL